MQPQTLRDHIQQCKNATQRPFGVNVPLLYPEIEKIMQVIMDEDVKIVFTSAGNPVTWTGILKSKGITVAHVVSNTKFAKKSLEAGVDAIVAEGFEAGGHNGREETTTLCLLPLVRDAVSIPLLAAGGIGTGRAMLAAEALGADGVQIGTRFAASEESSAHVNFKNRLVNLGEGETVLTMKQLTPVRLIKNRFYQKIAEAERKGSSPEDLKALLGKGRARQGIFEGDLDEGELEIGQAASYVNRIGTASEILLEIWNEYLVAKKTMINQAT